MYVLVIASYLLEKQLVLVVSRRRHCCDRHMVFQALNLSFGSGRKGKGLRVALTMQIRVSEAAPRLRSAEQILGAARRIPFQKSLVVVVSL